MPPDSGRSTIVDVAGYGGSSGEPAARYIETNSKHLKPLLESTMYTLQRLSDGAGDSGGMSEALWIGNDGKVCVERDARPRVGAAVRVGSLYARTMQYQDWWLTTPVTRILEDSGDRVIFETRSGSRYEWRVR